MKIQITLYCPGCRSANVKRTGKKSSKKQNYFCKNCGRQFIGNHALSYKGCHVGTQPKDSTHACSWCWNKRCCINCVVCVRGKTQLKAGKAFNGEIKNVGYPNGRVFSVSFKEKAYFAEHHPILFIS
jgi:hypothetical protein